jgi:hypothetical protein
MEKFQHVHRRADKANSAMHSLGGRSGLLFAASEFLLDCGLDASGAGGDFREDFVGGGLITVFRGGVESSEMCSEFVEAARGGRAGEGMSDLDQLGKIVLKRRFGLRDLRFDLVKVEFEQFDAFAFIAADGFTKSFQVYAVFSGYLHNPP